MCIMCEILKCTWQTHTHISPKHLKVKTLLGNIQIFAIFRFCNKVNHLGDLYTLL